MDDQFNSKTLIIPQAAILLWSVQSQDGWHNSRREHLWFVTSDHRNDSKCKEWSNQFPMTIYNGLALCSHPSSSSVVTTWTGDRYVPAFASAQSYFPGAKIVCRLYKSPLYVYACKKDCSMGYGNNKMIQNALGRYKILKGPERQSLLAKERWKSTQLWKSSA